METRQGNLEYSATVLENINPINTLIKREKVYYKTTKRVFDIICGIFGVILLIPLTIIVYIGNFLSKDKGPVFYVQKRIGTDGKLFKIYKYRTMVVGADKKLRKYLKENPDIAKEYEKYKKLNNDPRITKFGILLRKTSLDEFPQFINVLKGNMSIVGPRPYLYKEKKDMKKYYKTIITCKPGLTCIWQVSGRSKLSFEERLKLDVEYIKNKSIKMDLKLIIKTFTKIFKKEGAI